jgi:peroxiredoxin Q/BCP
MLKINDIAPDFVLNDEHEQPFHLADHRGEKLLLVFYPGDDTPVCTRQLCDYRDGAEAFTGMGVKVIGISTDDAASHRSFKDKHQLPFKLLTDARLEVAAQYDSKGLMGMKRALYLIDENGLIRYRHVESLALFRRQRAEVLEALRSIGLSQSSNVHPK